MRPFIRSTVLALTFLVPSARIAWAWGSPGHMAIAYLAWTQLTTDQQARVTALLKLNPYYSRWDQYLTAAKPNLSQPEHDRDIFMLASTWPDEIKSDSSYTGTDVAPPGTPVPETGAAYGDGHLHKYWHFIDTPYSTDGSAPSTTPSPNVQDQIIFFSGLLKDSTATDDAKSFALSWLEHLVGDIHQPLHATTRYTGGKSDNGGNSVKLKGASAPTLHGFWDDLPGATHGGGAAQIPDIDLAIAFASKAPTLTTAQKDQLQDTTVADWTKESYKLGVSDAYAPPVTTGTSAVSLTTTYKTRALKDAHLRVAFAGARLAALLQSNLS